MIGICTPFKIDNFGTKLQAYAVQEKIRSMGYACEIINFDRKSDMRVSRLVKRYCNASFVRAKISKKKQAAYGVNADALKTNLKIRRNAINSFDKEHYATTDLVKGYKKLSNLAERYDAVVCGSDQIWLPSSIYNPTVTLEFVPQGCRRIAFAPSFGISEIPAGKERYYSKFLSQFDFLSVRETRGAEIIKALIGKDVPVVLDPTLAVERNVWDKLTDTGRDLVSGRYIFCYFLGTDGEHRKAVYRFAQDHGLKIVTLPHFKGYVQEDEELSDIKLYDVTPCDFIRLIRNAEVVCTDSFHATVFSLLYHKTFYTFERFRKGDQNSANSRIYSLLGMLGLENRIMSNESGFKFEQQFVDFCQTDAVLDEARKKTNEYLQNCLAGIEKANENVVELEG